MENSFGEYDRRMLSSVSIEARIPKFSLFQGPKIPQISVDNKVVKFIEIIYFANIIFVCPNHFTNHFTL